MHKKAVQKPSRMRRVRNKNTDFSSPVWPPCCDRGNRWLGSERGRRAFAWAWLDRRKRNWRADGQSIQTQEEDRGGGGSRQDCHRSVFCTQDEEVGLTRHHAELGKGVTVVALSLPFVRRRRNYCPAMQPTSRKERKRRGN